MMERFGLWENLAVLWWFMIGCKYLDTLKLRWGHFIIFNASVEIERQRSLFSSGILKYFPFKLSLVTGQKIVVHINLI